MAWHHEGLWLGDVKSSNFVVASTEEVKQLVATGAIPVQVASGSTSAGASDGGASASGSASIVLQPRVFVIDVEGVVPVRWSSSLPLRSLAPAQFENLPVTT